MFARVSMMLAGTLGGTTGLLGGCWPAKPSASRGGLPGGVVESSAAEKAG